MAVAGFVALWRLAAMASNVLGHLLGARAGNERRTKIISEGLSTIFVTFSKETLGGAFFWDVKTMHSAAEART